MTLQTNNANTIDALSDAELDAVSGGKKARVQVTKEQYDQINEVRKMFMELK